MCALMCDAGSWGAPSHGNMVFSAIEDVYIYCVSSEGSFFLCFLRHTCWLGHCLQQPHTCFFHVRVLLKPQRRDFSNDVWQIIFPQLQTVFFSNINYIIICISFAFVYWAKKPPVWLQPCCTGSWQSNGDANWLMLGRCNIDHVYLSLAC